MKLKSVAPVAAVLWAILAGVWFLFGPSYATVRTSSSFDANGNPVESVMRGYGTGLEANGPDAFLALGIPVLLAAVPLVTFGKARRPAQILAATSLIAFCVLSMASIGTLYLPSVVLLLLASLPPNVERPT